MSTEKTKQFSLRTVLTVTTGRLLTEPRGEKDNGIGDLYELLEWMAMESPFTHQLGRFADECCPHLFRLFPELGLASACLPKLDEWLEKSKDCPQEGIKIWLTELRMMFPQIQLEYDVPQFPVTHMIKDPLVELQEIAPHVKIIGVQAETEDSTEWPEDLGDCNAEQSQ